MNDILEIHYRIVNFFNEKNKNLEFTVQLKEKLNNILQSNQISQRLRRIIENDLDNINVIVNCIENLECLSMSTLY